MATKPHFLLIFLGEDTNLIRQINMAEKTNVINELKTKYFWGC